MRVLEEFDRRIVDRIIELDKNNNVICLINIAFDLKDPLIGSPIDFQLIVNSPNDVSIALLQDEEKAIGQSKLKELHQSLLKKFYAITGLLDCMVAEGYLRYSEYALPESNWNPGENGYVVFDIFPPKLQSKIWQYEACHMIMLPILLVFQREGYLDIEQKKAKRVETHSKISLGIAILSLTISIVIPILINKYPVHVVIDGSSIPIWQDIFLYKDDLYIYI